MFLDHVTLRYRIPREVVVTLKEYALRKLQGRMEHNTLVALRDVNLTVAPRRARGRHRAERRGQEQPLPPHRARAPAHGGPRSSCAGASRRSSSSASASTASSRAARTSSCTGALMGFSREEMLGRMDAIAAFAELEEFLDAPIRTYSTGMAARLAFSVATDVDPDILLVDEALSVGDERFRAKCRDRMAGFRETRQDVPPRLAQAARRRRVLHPRDLDLGGPRRAGRPRRRGLRRVPRVGAGRVSSPA